MVAFYFIFLPHNTVDLLSSLLANPAPPNVNIFLLHHLASILCMQVGEGYSDDFAAPLREIGSH